MHCEPQCPDREPCATCHGTGTIRGREYLSGQRPIPDTPAPHEVDATLVKLIDLLTRTANAVKGQPGEMKQHGWADLPELCAALTARVAELERMLLAVYYRKDEGLTDEDFAAVIALITAVPGKEPTSE